MNRTLGIALLFSVSCFACADKTTNNYTTLPENEGQVMGHVVPGEDGTDVSLWQAEMVSSTKTDAEGYFTLRGMPSGLYSLRVSAPSGAHCVWSDVQVDENQDVSLGTVATSPLPAPLFLIWPEGSDISVGSYYSLDPIYLWAESDLDPSSMEEDIQIDPPLPGQWVRRSSGGQPERQILYEYQRESAFRPSTEYSITIGPGLRPLGGEPWGKTYVHHFTTEPFHSSYFWYPGNGGDRTLQPGFTGTLVNIQFNAKPNPDSFESGVTITPAAQLELSYNSNNSSLLVGIVRPLDPGTDYEIRIGPPLSDLYGAPLDSVGVVRFKTAPFALTTRDLTHYEDGVPLTGNYRGLFTDHYNMSIDVASARAAVSISPDCALRIEGGYSDGFSVSLDGALQPSTDYTVTIAPSLASTSGLQFGSTQTVHFRSERLKLYRVDIYNQYYGGAGPLNPSGPLFIRAAFNLDVDPTAFTQAVSISPNIPGLWYQGEGSDPTIEFLSTDPTPLAAGQQYTLRVLGSVPLAGSSTIGTDFVQTFQVSPVQVAEYYPRNGGANQSRSTDVYIRFNSIMDVTATEAAFQLRLLEGDAVPGSFSWDDSHQEFRFHPNSDLEAGQLYKIMLSTEARDEVGHQLEAAVESTFRTGS